LTPRCRNSLETNELRLEDARHPVLEDKLRKENRAIVPMTLTSAERTRPGDQRTKYRRQNGWR